MRVDLQSMRERKGLTRDELAATLNYFAEQSGSSLQFTRDRLLKLEREPEKISLEELGLVIKVFGVTFDQLLQPEIGRLSPPAVVNNWSYIRDLGMEFDREAVKAPAYIRASYGRELEQLRCRLTRKGRIAFIGRPDAGKSRIINTLLGEDILPTGWTPVTSAFIMLKSMHDRPKYMGFQTVYIAKEGQGEQWNPDYFADEEYCRSWELARGGYNLIREYGSHGGSEESKLAGAIVVYVDSPFLDNCDLLDLPGFGQVSLAEENLEIGEVCGSRDTVLSERAAALGDAFVYLSIANSFLYGDDLAMAAGVVKNLPTLENQLENKLPPFGNLFLVASQALTVNRGDRKELERICDSACERLWQLLDLHPALAEKMVDSNGYEYSRQDLRRRFFFSELDSADLSRDFYQELGGFVGHLPKLLAQQRVEGLAEYFALLARSSQQRQNNLRRQLEQVGEKRVIYAQYWQLHRDKVDRLARLKEEIEAEMGKTADSLETYYYSVVNAQNVHKILEANNLGKNKKDLLKLITLLTGELEKGLAKLLTANAAGIMEKLDGILNDWEDSGAFCLSIGQCGQAGALTDLKGCSQTIARGDQHFWQGIKQVTGMALAFSLVRVVSVALQGVLGYGGTWRSLIGNRFVKEFAGKKVLEKLTALSDEYWQNTLSALDRGMAALKEEMGNKELSTVELKKALQEAEQAEEYFGNFGSRFWLWQAGDGRGIRIG